MKNCFLKSVLCIVTSVFCSYGYTQPASHQIAITIDDLPFVGESKNFHLGMIIDAFKSNEVPATGFIIAGNVTPDVLPSLRKFRDAGLGLGNHTYSHVNLNKVQTERYLQEIENADHTLAPVMTEPKFFRYPYLAMSKGGKKDMVMSFLAAKNYQIAPVTIDSKDFMFNQLLMSVPEKQRRSFMEALKPCYLNFIWQQTLDAEERMHSAHKDGKAQILLIHANLLNAYALPDIIHMFKENNYNFVSLEAALKAPEQTKQLAKKEEKEEPISSFLAWD